jgi:endonuclease-3
MEVGKDPNHKVKRVAKKPAAVRNALGKRPFVVSEGFAKIEKSIASFPKAAMFELAEKGFNETFQQLVACVISIRTLDEVSLSAALRLLSKAPTPAKLAKLSIAEIDEMIGPSTFHRQKASTLQNIAQQTVERFQGKLPCEEAALLSLKGVGPKCAHLVLGVSCAQPFIAVDTHVHRVTNRWGYVQALSPEKTMLQLEAKLPRKYWIEINRLLVPFGKHICTWTRPKCSTCPVLDMCQQVGVKNPR